MVTRVSSKQMAKFPDFVIIGFMKCGTAALWRNLNRHPKITMCNNPEDPKPTSTEIRFWSNCPPHRTWRKGIEWYKSLFRGEVSGEKSPNYVEVRRAMRRMAKHMPDVKLVVCVRNPVERAYSHYQMAKQNKPDKYPSFERALKRNKDFFKTGLYLKRLEKNVLRYFSRHQLFVVVQEWMYRHVNREMSKVHEFLGVEEQDLETWTLSADERDVELDKYRRWRTEYEPMDPLTRESLLQEYAAENQRFFEFLGYEIPEWYE